jgi:hypothetical protein
MPVPKATGSRIRGSFFFVIGTGRCGKAMMAEFLNARSQVYVPHELLVVFTRSNNGVCLAEIFDFR